MINILRIEIVQGRFEGVEAFRRRLTSSDSEIINQLLNIRGGERSVGAPRAEYTALRACVRTCVHACTRPHGRVVSVWPRIRVRAPSSIRRAECKRVYALRQVCARVNYVFGRRVYRHPVNLHRPRGLHGTPRYGRQYTSIHRCPDALRPRRYGRSFSTSLGDKAPEWPAGPIGLDAFMGFPTQTNVPRIR